VDDERYIEEALTLAEKGRGHTHPNPMVGAVIVRDGEIVGRGSHEGPGKPHAEVLALAEAGDKARGATLVCTLEPCCHHGQTPPCTDALIAAGIARAVVALRDPNPLVDGGGLALLEQAGVTVEVLDGHWAQRARRQNAAFLKYHMTGLPFVTYKAAVTLDGKVAGARGDARWISCLDSRRAVHQLRSACDAVMIGAGTLRRDDPELTVRLAEGRDPARVVVTRSGILPPAARLLTTARSVPTIVIAESADEGTRLLLEARGAELIEVGEGGLRAGLAALAGQGILDVLCEGGPGLAGSLLSQGLIDRVLLFVAPLVVGRGAPDLFAAPAVNALAEAWRLRDVEWRQVCDDLMISGTLTRFGD
jgi:diaminohydroxyphosphoribosylaminopyrimidine deaminase/5-amino-6-(5-phosphoribosylamino)uracil reductase